MKALGKNADNFMRFAIENDGLPEDSWRAAEFFLPVAVSEDDRLWSGGGIVLAGEGSAQHGRNAKQRDNAVADP